MKLRLVPVILTAAITSICTLFVAARFQQHLPLLGSAHNAQLPVNFASYGGPASGAAPVNFESAAEASVKAVVHIKTTVKGRTVVEDGNGYGNDFFGDLFGRREYYVPQQMGSGSGVVISPDGYIVTNNHVVDGASDVTVTFNDRYTTKAQVVGSDPQTDIAVIKVDEKNLPYMEFGNSDDVHLGQWVLAVGYPLTLDATVTAGIVSAKGRSIGINRTKSASAVESFIQTDAAVNPGNSGGALVNTSGQLIGINSAIASPTGSYAGYSYAIPANIVHKAVNDLMKYGMVQRPYLGIALVDINKLSADQLHAMNINDRASGVYVAEVLPARGAAKAGITKGDFITKINGEPVQTEGELLGIVNRYQPGDNVSVTYVRNGSEYNTNVQLTNRNGTTGILKEESTAKVLGMSLRPLSDNEKAKYGIDGGLMVTDISSGAIAKQTNMRKGFVIIGINDMAVNSINDMQTVLANSGDKARIAGTYPGNNSMYYFGINNIADELTKE